LSEDEREDAPSFRRKLRPKRTLDREGGVGLDALERLGRVAGHEYGEQARLKPGLE
jgi:hypothetical protein